MLAEIGLSLPSHPPRAVTPEMMDAASVRVTMGCLDDDSCPIHLKSLPLRDWALPDPATQDDPGFRRIRDEIVERIQELFRELRALENTYRPEAGVPPR